MSSIERYRGFAGMLLVETLWRWRDWGVAPETWCCDEIRLGDVLRPWELTLFVEGPTIELSMEEYRGGNGNAPDG